MPGAFQSSSQAASLPRNSAASCSANGLELEDEYWRAISSAICRSVAFERIKKHALGMSSFSCANSAPQRNRLLLQWRTNIFAIYDDVAIFRSHRPQPT